MSKNTYPSTAHYDGAEYIHDPLNQPLAEAAKQGKFGAHSQGQLEHPFGQPGYCAKHLVLGCLECRNITN